jgi:hypothetical protein
MKSFSLILLLGVLMLNSCIYVGGKRTRGNGNIVTEERSVGNFDKVEVRGAIDVYVSQGSAGPVKIEADENLQKYILVEESGGRLVVKTKNGYNLRPSKKMKVYVSAPHYTELKVSGSCNIIGENKITSPDRLSLGVSGAGDIKMEADAPQVEARISGSGNVDLKGNTRDFDLQLSGAGKARCYELLSENTEVDISGAGSAEVYASVRLDAKVSGAGNVRYKGDGSIGENRVSGAGSIKKAE